MDTAPMPKPSNASHCGSLAVLLWADREKLSLLLLNREQARAIEAAPPTLSAFGETANQRHDSCNAH